MRTRPTSPRTTPRPLDDAYFRRLFDGAGLAICAIDRSGRVLAWNPHAEQLFRRRGIAPGAEAALEAVLPADDRRTFRDQLAAVLRSQQSTEFRTRMEFADGGHAEYAVWLAPVRDDQGEIEHVSVWFHDITARLQLRRSMRSRERLTTLGTLSGSIAHHYSNLLCSIATSVEYALNMNTLTATRKALGRAMDALQRATELTHQLLAFAQGDHRGADLADLTETVLYYFDQKEAALARQGIRLELTWERLPTLPVHREHMLTLLDHLVRNAVEAMPEGGTLSVALRRRDEQTLSLTIADTGPGIPPEHLEHIFEPFFTTKGTLAAGTTRQSGMGLAVAYGLVSEMHGSISARNLPAGGACFEIVLPLPAPTEAPRTTD